MVVSRIEGWDTGRIGFSLMAGAYFRPPSVGEDVGEDRPRRRSMAEAAAVLPIISAELQAAKAAALRDAAEDLFYDGDQDVPIEGNALLHSRADEYEAGGRA